MTGAVPAGAAMAPGGRRRRCGYASGMAVRNRAIARRLNPLTARNAGISANAMRANIIAAGITSKALLPRKRLSAKPRKRAPPTAMPRRDIMAGHGPAAAADRVTRLAHSRCYDLEATPLS